MWIAGLQIAFQTQRVFKFSSGLRLLSITDYTFTISIVGSLRSGHLDSPAEPCCASLRLSSHSVASEPGGPQWT